MAEAVRAGKHTILLFWLGSIVCWCVMGCPPRHALHISRGRDAESMMITIYRHRDKNTQEDIWPCVAGKNPCSYAIERQIALGKGANFLLSDGMSMGAPTRMLEKQHSQSSQPS